MGQQEEYKAPEAEISFYSDDSYEYCPVDQSIAYVSSFKNIHKVIIPHLDFTDLPEYETSDEEEEEEE